MKLKKTILAGINLSYMDEKVLVFTKMLKSVIQPEKIVFYHVIEPDPDDVDGLGEEEAKLKVQEKVKKEFAGDWSEKESFTFELGDAQKLLLKQSEEANVDLMVLGRKISERNLILTNDLINTAKCSLFLIPEHASLKISKIVVGVDFSDEAQQGLDAAVSIASQTGAEIHCINIYHVPSGYHTSGKDYDEYAEIMKQNAIKASEKFCRKHQLDRVSLNFEFLLDDDGDPADKLYEYAKSIDADLICVGTKGLDSFAGLFFNTTTEKIVGYSNHIPTLIIKGKDKNRSLLDAIREL